MAKPSLLILHGALGSQAQMEVLRPHLEAHFDLHFLEFEGHGSKAFSGRNFAIEHFAANLETYILQNQLAPAQIFGYSMGGYVALYLAAQNPRLVGKVMTLATKLDWNAQSAAKESKMLDPESISEKVPHFAAMLKARHHGNDWQEHLRLTAAMMLDLGQNPRINAELLGKLNLPVRFCIGDRDSMVSLEETIWAFRQLKGAELQVLPSTPHPIEKINLRDLAHQIQVYFIEA